MAATFTIEPDEFLGLSALIDLGQTANGDGTDTVTQAKTLMRRALADKLEDAERPGAPSAEAVKQCAAEAAGADTAMRRLMGSKRMRKDAAYALAVAMLVALWGGYARGWNWTGFRANGQRWDWLRSFGYGRHRHHPVVAPEYRLHQPHQARHVRSRHRGLDRVRDRRLPGSAQLDGLPRRDAMGLVRAAPAAGGTGGGDSYAGPLPKVVARCAVSEGNDGRPRRRVDRDRDRRFRPAVDVDRLRRQDSLRLAPTASPAAGFPAILLPAVLKRVSGNAPGAPARRTRVPWPG